MVKFIKKLVNGLIDLQSRYAVYILLFGLALSIVSARPAIKLLTNVKTDLIHLLPDDYASVKYTEEVRTKFNRRSSLHLVINSPDPKANKAAMFAVRDYIQQLPSVDYIEIEKRGFDFFDKNKLLLVDLNDIYTIHDKLKDRIQKKKLGALYIDLEGDSGKDKGEDFDSLVKKYNDEFANGVSNRYLTNKDETVFVINIFPKSTDASLKFFKQFGEEIAVHVNKFDFKKFSPDMTYGYAGAIKTRVDQYDALMEDLGFAGMISLGSILFFLYLYFYRFFHASAGLKSFLVTSLVRLVPVVAVFVPMVMSTLVAFAFCAQFFANLNVVTSFLFSIIFGLGVDIGIHLISRFLHDRHEHLDIKTIHRNVMTKTGNSCVVSILTTVASFYILVVNDFKGFSEFGWIAGNGLLIALICYMVFFPCILLLIHRYKLLPLKFLAEDEAHVVSKPKRKWLPWPRLSFAIFILITLASLFSLPYVGFEWDFSKLKMKFEQREHWKELLKQTNGRVNSPAVYLVDNEVQAHKIRQVIQHRKEADKDFETIHFFRSYYDMAPMDQGEKLAMLQKIKVMLEDDALNAVNDDEKKMIDELKTAINDTHALNEKDLPKEIHDMFWGEGGHEKTISFIAPLPQLELDNGYNARAFYQDVHDVKVLGKEFFAISDAMVFAEVLQTLFRDAKTATILSLSTLIILIALDFRNTKRTVLVVGCLACGIFWMFGIMAIFDIKLNFYNMIIIPAMIGMGEDNSVHVVHRFDEMGHVSMYEVLRTSGRAAFMASLITILGYSGMCFTSHPGLSSIGWMAIIGMGTCLVSSLVMLPFCCQLFIGKK